MRVGLCVCVRVYVCVCVCVCVLLVCNIDDIYTAALVDVAEQIKFSSIAYSFSTCNAAWFVCILKQVTNWVVYICLPAWLASRNNTPTNQSLCNSPFTWNCADQVEPWYVFTLSSLFCK